MKSLRDEICLWQMKSKHSLDEIKSTHLTDKNRQSKKYQQTVFADILYKAQTLSLYSFTTRNEHSSNSTTKIAEFFKSIFINDICVKKKL